MVLAGCVGFMRSGTLAERLRASARLPSPASKVPFDGSRDTVHGITQSRWTIISIPFGTHGYPVGQPSVSRSVTSSLPIPMDHAPVHPCRGVRWVDRMVPLDGDGDSDRRDAGSPEATHGTAMARSRDCDRVRSVSRSPAMAVLVVPSRDTVRRSSRSPEVRRGTVRSSDEDTDRRRSRSRSPDRRTLGSGSHAPAIS
jgi:hypothetical protein